MEWFTLGPKALTRLRNASGALRDRLGTSHATERVKAMDPTELADFVNEVLSLMDESEAILGRVRSEAPERKPLPNPMERDRVVAPRAPTELPSSNRALPKPFTRPRRSPGSELLPRG